jgi:dTDP-4-dehydrorhamnose 3,5-epimerase
MMKIEEAPLKGLYVLTPEVLEDNRGYFMEFYRKDYFAALGVDLTFVQQNLSVSKKNVVRALHFQWDPPLGKLVRVAGGRAFAVGVDIRKKSPTLGKWFGVELDNENRKSLYAPPGFAFGFCALEDSTQVQYLYTVLRNANAESSIRWNDPEIGIVWPLAGEPILSEKDADAQSFMEWLVRQESNSFN